MQGGDGLESEPQFQALRLEQHLPLGPGEDQVCKSEAGQGVARNLPGRELAVNLALDPGERPGPAPVPEGVRQDAAKALAPQGQKKRGGEQDKSQTPQHAGILLEAVADGKVDLIGPVPVIMEAVYRKRYVHPDGPAGGEAAP